MGNVLLIFPRIRFIFLFLLSESLKHADRKKAGLHREDKTKSRVEGHFIYTRLEAAIFTYFFQNKNKK